ncbi:MAG TPA: hypothetical protein VIC57_18595 [Candidatus Dormibacteraeota bacterium]|jgi:hypothetical protein
MTVMNVVLPLAACLVSLVFAALVLDQWRQRRRAFQAIWGVGLVWYAISSGTQFAGAAFGWNPWLYRAWYLFGALLVAAYLGMGTVSLLSRTGFAHFAGVSIALGGLFALLSQLALTREGHPTAGSNVALVIGLAAVAGLAVIVATAWRREAGATVALLELVAGTVVVAALAITAPLAPPGYALDPSTHAPVGLAVPGHLRIVTGPFNIAGALCLVGGALFSVYVYMPKRKVVRGSVRTPVLGQLHRALAVLVNLVASAPLAVRALASGELNSRVPATVLIALGGFVPSLTGGLERFGVTWSFALGELVGVLLIFAGFLVSEEVLRGARFGALPAPWRRNAAAGRG